MCAKIVIIYDKNMPDGEIRHIFNHYDANWIKPLLQQLWRA